MIVLQVQGRGVVLPVRAQPGARRNGILGEHAGALRVSVTQSPEKGKANKAILEVLCRGLALRKSQIELASGETSQQKRFLVYDIAIDELQRRLQEFCD